MPELPEVQTTVQGLQLLVNKEIINIKIYSIKLRYNIPKKIYKVLKHNTILKIFRIGKYIVINLGINYSLIFHLGMTGRLRVLKSSEFAKRKHDHLILATKKHILIFNDVRKFGFVDLVKTNKMNEKKYFAKLGPDALDRRLNYKYLQKKIYKSIVPIKQILLDQKIIAGIGNIYASEILFDAKISPFVFGSHLKIFEIKKIIRSTKKILIKAINSGGSSLRDYMAVDGTLGNFQKNFKVYNQDGKKIRGKEIKRVIQYGRSTFYCPEIQLSKKNFQNDTENRK